MLKPNVQDALNNQLNAELASSYLYLSMAAHFETRNLHGMAQWMYAQAREEWNHAMRIFKHIVDRSGQVVLKAVDAPQAQWDSVLKMFEDAHQHEIHITGRIHGLVKLAVAEGDFATQAFLQWFVTEQVEEEAQVLVIVEKIKMMGDGNIGLVILDAELGKRSAS
jgi:ferritin